ncbi:MAG: alpha/beta hydrolase [Candidatus Pacebacteria bacterium]|jgi:alpha-beta hydrolase superfamily lysophospholipase|nr:alpha/beta hydrolase [Candidatus Paceibacterota bacterium]
MKTTLCRVTTKDLLRLDGALYEPDNCSKTAILHLHGRAGTFYANCFFEAMANTYAAAGFAFLAVNLRGHDQIADFRVGATDQIRRIGQAFDIFEECVFDIDAWLDFLRRRGFEKIILQGHSQGGCKAVYYLSQRNPRDVAALVLMSPADAAGLLKKISRENFKTDLALAQEMVADGRGEELLPRPIRGVYYVSAKSFADEFGPDSKANIFPVFEKGDFSKLENIKIPVLAFYGAKENLCVGSPEKDLAVIAGHLRHPNSKTLIMDGADHTYFGFEKQVSETVADWIKKKI